MRTCCRWLVVAVSAVACGGVSSKDFPAELEDARCENSVECNNQPDNTTCASTSVFAGNDFETTLADIESGLINYDEDAAAACLDELRDAGCVFDGVHQETSCDDVFTGTVAVGGACFIDQECKDHGGCNPTDTNCDPSAACCPGTCGPAAPGQVALGGVCQDSTDCVITSYCKPPATGNGDGVCTALVATEGATCDDLYACVNPLICDFFNDMPTCVRPAASGATCDPLALIECVDSRDYCDPTALKCIRRVAVGGACPTNVRCIGFASCINMVCVARPKLNETCTDSGPSCLGSLDCVAGTCQPAMPGMVCH